MDVQVQTGRTSASDAQQPVVLSIYPSPEHWSSVSLQSPAGHEVLSISSLVPSTILTVMPHYKPTTNGDLYPESASLSEVTSESSLPEASSSSSDSSEIRDQKTLTPKEVKQRKTSDGGPLEEGSVGLMLPKDLHDAVPGMVIFKGVGSKRVF